MNDRPKPYNMETTIQELAQLIDSPDQLRFAMTELTLLLWEDSDQSPEALTCMLGGLEASKLVLMMHLGDTYND